MKESLSYKVLITMQKRHRLKQNAVDRGESYEADNSYHYDGIGKRLSDLCNYGYAERKGDDEKGYLRYQVSDKGLCIKSFKDFYENTLKMKQYRSGAKKTREESAVKKECKKEDYSMLSTPVRPIAGNMDETISIRTNADLSQYEYIRIGENAFAVGGPHMMAEFSSPEDRDNVYREVANMLQPKKPRYKRLRSALTGK